MWLSGVCASLIESIWIESSSSLYSPFSSEIRPAAPGAPGGPGAPSGPGGPGGPNVKINSLVNVVLHLKVQAEEPLPVAPAEPDAPEGPAVPVAPVAPGGPGGPKVKKRRKKKKKNKKIGLINVVLLLKVRKGLYLLLRLILPLQQRPLLQLLLEVLVVQPNL